MKKEKETKTRVVTKMETTGYVCDQCGKEVSSSYLPPRWCHIEASWISYGDHSENSDDFCCAECFISNLHYYTINDIVEIRCDGSFMLDMEHAWAKKKKIPTYDEIKSASHDKAIKDTPSFREGAEFVLNYKPKKKERTTVGGPTYTEEPPININK